MSNPIEAIRKEVAELREARAKATQGLFSKGREFESEAEAHVNMRPGYWWNVGHLPRCDHMDGLVCPDRDAEFFTLAANEWNALLDKYLKLAEALEFYADGSHWSTHEDEMHFNNVSDKDWRKNAQGHFVGGKIANDCLSEVGGE